ncbi:MAG: hypothetical protein K2Q18_06435, partial [Bdellovibrionales bacterium]|nr:hypothetical protein [Bdellovibrionales bacterium]
MKARHVLILFSSILLSAFAGFAQTITTPSASDSLPTPAVKAYCEKLQKSFKRYGWDESQCEKFKWNHYRNSVLGDPLMWTVFGDVSDEEQPSFKDKDVTVVMCGVHGDEITPVKFCFDLMYYLRDAYSDPELKAEFHNKVVLVSPLVNPDSYFKARPTRVNARGVDPNRNFPTADWQKEARKLWLTKLKRDKRKNPGEKPLSEPEVIYQVNLI